MVRLGLIADIHGNHAALEAALDELAADRVDRLLCLGDVAVLGPEPAAVVARLRELGCPLVLGNTDAWLSDPPAWDRRRADEAREAELTAWCAAQLSAADLAYLRAAPLTLAFDLAAGARLLAFHGSPRSHEEVISATTPATELAEMVGDTDATLLVGGHTHIPLLRRYRAAYLLNPGSLGLPGVGPGTPDLPRNTGVHWGEYAVLEAGEGRLRIDFRRMPLDVVGLAETARRRGMPHAHWWRDRWLAAP